MGAQIAVLTEEVDNFRPLTSIFLYMRRKRGQYKKLGGHGKDYSEALNCTLCKVLLYYWKIPFVKKWLRHNLLTAFSGLLEVAREWATSRCGLIPDPYKDRCVKDARRDYNRSNQNNGTPFILYSHTHLPAQIPLTRATNKKDPDAVYINTGTWRPRIIQTADGQEYVNLNTMTYVVFYGPGEDSSHKKGGTRSFDVWTGWQSKQRV